MEQEQKIEQVQKQGGKKTSNSDILKWVIIGFLALIIIVLVFGIGIRVGLEKARFSYGWAENYHKNFGGPRMGFMDDWRQFPAGDFIEGHGSFGEIIKINNDNLVIKGGDNAEKVILLKGDTIIERFRETLKPGDLKVGDFIVVIGSPNDSGQIEAKLIRVLPDQQSFLPPLNIR